MKDVLKHFQLKYPLFYKLVVFQFMAIILGSAVLFFTYMYISDRYVTTAIEHEKEHVVPKLEAQQEQWRTWKYMSLNDALQPSLKKFKESFLLESLDVISVNKVPKELTDYDIIIPQATDPVISYVVHAKVSKSHLGYIEKMRLLLIFVVTAILIVFVVNCIVTARFLFRWYYRPIGQLNEAITDMNASGNLAVDKISAPGEIGLFVNHFKQMTHSIRGYERMGAVAKIASQIVCVLRPYIEDLKNALTKKYEMTPDNLDKMKKATKGIENIIDDLHERNRRVHDSLESIDDEELKTNGSHGEEFSKQLLFSVIDSLVSEKRMQYNALSNLKIDMVSDKGSYGMFVKIKVLVLRKILSNIIDVFAESMNQRENIIVKLDGCFKTARLTISDDITADVDDELFSQREPEDSELIEFDKESVFEKARHVLRSWSGDVVIKTAENRGTMISLTLPRQHHEKWLLSNLELEPDSLIVILHDDKSIHRVWDNSLVAAGLKQKNVLHFYSPQEFEKWFKEERQHQQLRSGLDTLLVAYQFIDSKKNGLDLIEEYKLKSRSIIVTSQFKRPRLRKHCAGLGIKILPKSLVNVVPILVTKMVEKPDCILIAEDERVQVYWRMEARLKGKDILTFDGPEDFFQHKQNYNRNIPIYVTATLSGGIKGADFSHQLTKVGFQNVYIATGSRKKEFQSMPWIKGVVDKNPPWAVSSDE